jgi:hypothetical protein
MDKDTLESMGYDHVLFPGVSSPMKNGKYEIGGLFTTYGKPVTELSRTTVSPGSLDA